VGQSSPSCFVRSYQIPARIPLLRFITPRLICCRSPDPHTHRVPWLLLFGLIELYPYQYSFQYPFPFPYICKQPVAKCLANTGNKTRLTTAGTTAPPILKLHVPHTSHSLSRRLPATIKVKDTAKEPSSAFVLATAIWGWGCSWGWGWGSAGVQLQRFSQAAMSIHWAKDLLSRTLQKF